jgi:hypothetical protein
MNGRFETSGIFPLSVEPAEGYGSDPLTRSGKIVITHTNRKFVKVVEGGHTFVEDRKDASRFDNYSKASLAAADLIEQESRKRGRQVELVD